MSAHLLLMLDKDCTYCYTYNTMLEQDYKKTLLEELSKCKGLLSENGILPLYAQVELILQYFIENRFVPGDPFFTEMEVASCLGVSRPTANRAIKGLIQKGFITRQRRRKAQVAPIHNVPLVFMSELLSFGEMLERMGKTYTTKLLARQCHKAGMTIAEKLGISSTESVIYLKRLRFVEGEPILVVESFLPYSRFKRLAELDPENFRTDLYKLLREVIGIQVSRAEREVWASRVSPEDAKLLGVPVWEPCLRLRGVTYDEQGDPVEFFDSRLKGTRCVLRSQLSQSLKQ